MRMPTMMLIIGLCAVPLAMTNAVDHLPDSFRIARPPYVCEPPAAADPWAVSRRPLNPLGQVSVASVTAEYLSSTLWSYMTDVEVAGNLAYCTFQNGLAIIDISDVAAPQWLSSVYLHQERGLSVVLSNGYAYVAQGYAGLQIVDVRDPADPRLVGCYDTPGYAWRVSVSGNYAYFTDLDALWVIDISDPTAPTLACQLRPGYNLRDVAIAPGYAYVSGYPSDLFVVDISDPANAVVIDHLTAGGYPEVLLISGDSLLVFTNGDGGLSIFDISDPASPSYLSGYAAGSPAIYAAMHGNFVAAGCLEFKLRIVTPDEPSPFAPSVGFDSMQFAEGVASNGAHVFAADLFEGLKIVDYPTPDSVPVLVGEYAIAPRSLSVKVEDGFAYILCSANSWTDYSKVNLCVVDVSNPADPVPLEQYYMSHSIVSIDVANNRCYVSFGRVGLRIFDISPTGDLTLAGADTSIAPGHILVGDSLAYVANSEGLQIVNVSDPVAMGYMGTLTLPSGAADIAVSGDFAYLIDGVYLYIVDLSNPADPAEVGSIVIPDGAGRVRVSGHFAYVLNNSGLRKIDVAAPASPVLVSSYDTPIRKAREFTMAGNYALISDWLLSQRENSAVLIVDMTDAAHPVLTEQFPTPRYPWEITVAGRQCYVADESSLLVFSLSFPPVGDLDGAFGISASDLIYLVNYVFKRGRAPLPNPAVGDVNCSGSIDAADIIYLLNYIFRAGPAPGC